MKTKQIWKLMVLTLMLGVFLGQQAKAFYDPSVGRWLSRDSIGERGGKNLYDFVQNCPIGAIDGLGLVTGSFNVQFSTPQFGEGLVGWSVRFDWRPPSSWPLKCAPCEKAVWVQDYRFHSDFYWTFNWVNDWHIANYGGNSTPWVNGAWSPLLLLVSAVSLLGLVGTFGLTGGKGIAVSSLNRGKVNTSVVLPPADHLKNFSITKVNFPAFPSPITPLAFSIKRVIPNFAGIPMFNVRLYPERLAKQFPNLPTRHVSPYFIESIVGKPGSELRINTWVEKTVGLHVRVAPKQITEN